MYSINDLYEKLPKNTGVTLAQLEKLVTALGTYRELGGRGGKVMLEEDIRDFFTAISARRAKPIPPPNDAAGLIVFIGHATDHECLVFVSWTPIGQELVLLDRIREGAQEPVMVLATANATPRDVAEFRAAHKKSWRYGSWFSRTDRFVESIRELTEPGFENEDEGETVEHAVSEAVGEEGAGPKHSQH
jgi:hypothetical protein